MSESEPNITVTPDHRVRKAVENYATQAISYALNHFNIEPYWIDERGKKV